MIGGNLWNKKYVSKATGKDIDNIAGGGKVLLVECSILEATTDIPLDDQIEAFKNGTTVILKSHITDEMFGIDEDEYIIVTEYLDTADGPRLIGYDIRNLIIEDVDVCVITRCVSYRNESDGIDRFEMLSMNVQVIS